MPPKSKWELLLDLLKSLWSFFTGWKKNEQEISKEKFNKVSKELNNEYNKVDENKDKNKSKDIEDRLNNMF